MTIKNLIEKYEKSIEGLEEGMSLFDDEGGAVYASFAREVEIYETVIADLQELEQPESKLIAKVTFDKEQLQEIVQKEVIEKIKSGELVIQEERPQVAYLCKYHKEPHYCKHTTRIEDALNFVKLEDGKYIEKETSHGDEKEENYERR